MHGAIELAKTRRKPIATRTKSGQISRAGEREFPPTQVKRLRDAALQGLRDPEWGSELGRLYLENAITSAMYAAGRRWVEWAATYRNAIGAFPVRSASLEQGRGGSPPDPDSDEGRKIAKRERNAAERFFEAHAALIQCGMLTESIVRRVCEHGEACIGMAEFSRLRTGLSTLATHWGLDNSRNHANAG